jgi:hypothetical protein
MADEHAMIPTTTLSRKNMTTMVAHHGCLWLTATSTLEHTCGKMKKHSRELASIDNKS